MTGYIALIYAIASGLLNPPFVLIFLTAAVLLGVLLSTSALLMEELYYRSYPSLRDMAILFIFAIMENFFYRQLHTWWRIKGLFDFFFKKRAWGTLDRHSFTEKKAAGDN